MMKRCKECNLEKDEQEFVKHKGYSDGLYCYCKLCVSVKNKAYKPSLEAKERRKKNRTIYRNNNRRRIREQDRKRYRNSPEKYREKAKKAQYKYYRSGKGKEK